MKQYVLQVGRLATVALLGVLGFAVTSSPALACSICRCGDPTFNALGKDSYGVRGFRVAFDWERFDKQEGDPADESESQVENRVTALLSHGLGDRVTLLARVPVSSRRLTMSGAGMPAERLSTTGLSDPEIYAQVRLWASAFAGGVGQRSSLSLIGGLKTPWGRNDVRQDGVRVDEHAQPGTGATDFFGSLAFLYLVDKRSALFVSASYRHTGRNAFGYRYGRNVQANAAYEHKLGQKLDGVLELTFRDARRDVVDSLDTLDDDTGGALLYATPRLLMSLGHGVVLRAAAQVPIVRGLNGFQKERAVLSVGLTYLLGR